LEFQFKIKYAINALFPLAEHTMRTLFVISLSSFQEVVGLCSVAIKNSLDDYMGQCSKDYSLIKINKSINKIPNYYCCALEYVEDLQVGKITTDSMPIISIDEEFTFQNIKFMLYGTIYFQGLHYTAHVKGISHPKLLFKREDDWFYHDWMKPCLNGTQFSKDLLFESTLKFQTNLSSDEMKLSLLVYRIELFSD